MSLKTKKIVFSALTLGFCVLSMLFFIIPTISQTNGYQLLSLFQIAASSLDNPNNFIIFILWIFSLLFVILTPIMIAFSLIILLCDLDVIKNEKLRKSFKKALTIISTFQIVFVFLYILLCIVYSITNEVNLEIAGLILMFIVTLTQRIMIRFVGKVDKVEPESIEKKEDNVTNDDKEKEEAEK